MSAGDAWSEQDVLLEFMGGSGEEHAKAGTSRNSMEKHEDFFPYD
jgi:hypothetical protein